MSGSWEKGLARQQPWRKEEAEKAESSLSLCGQLKFFLPGWQDPDHVMPQLKIIQ